MDRYELMGWKALLPGGLWMLMSLPVVWALSGLQGSPLTDGLFSALRWGPVAMFGWGALLTCHALYRIWQWNRGEGLLCACGGILGSEINGRYGLYRKCLACGDNVNCRHYQ